MSNISIGRLRDGYCVYWWRDGKRVRYKLAARSPGEAEAEGRDKYLKENRPTSGHTVATIWQGYIEHLGKKPTAKTMKYTGKAVLAHFGPLRPDQITIADCRKYDAERTKAGRAVGSVHTELGHLRSALRWAHKTGLIARCPHIERPSKPDSDVKPLSQADSARLIDGCGAPHIRLAVTLLLTTGARIGALLDLTWGQIDFDRGVIDLRLKDGVTRKGRAVLPMNRTARAALESAYAARLTEYVIEWAGERVKSIRKGFAAALDRAKLDTIGIHQIRHTVAVRMLEAGESLVTVSQFLGHSNPQITFKTYARFTPEHMAGAASVLEFGRFGIAK